MFRLYAEVTGSATSLTNSIPFHLRPTNLCQNCSEKASLLSGTQEYGCLWEELGMHWATHSRKNSLHQNSTLLLKTTESLSHGRMNRLKSEDHRRWQLRKDESKAKNASICIVLIEGNSKNAIETPCHAKITSGIVDDRNFLKVKNIWNIFLQSNGVHWCKYSCKIIASAIKTPFFHRTEQFSTRPPLKMHLINQYNDQNLSNSCYWSPINRYFYRPFSRNIV